MTQDDVDERSATGADLAAAAARLVPQTEAMVFDLEELLVEREEMARAGAGRRPEFAPRVFQHFFLRIRHEGI